MKIVGLVLLLLSAMLHAKEVKWPSLSSFKYISGRAATEKDIINKSALFVAKINGRYAGSPVNIKLPQYALYIGQHGKKHKVVVVQAEYAMGTKIYGAVMISNGSGIVSLYKDFKLLGKTIK